MKKIVLALSLLVSSFSFSQVGINTTAPNSVLDIVSTNSGILIPRATGNQIEAMTVNTTKEAMLVFATAVSTNTSPIINKLGFWYYNSKIGTWKPLDSDTKEWERNGDFLYDIQARENNTDIVFKNNGSFIIGSSNFNPTSHVTGLKLLVKENGITSLAVGDYTRAYGNNSFAFGPSASAGGNSSFAMGAQAYAEADNSIAFGGQSRGNANNSIAIGNNTVTNGENSTAIGPTSKTDAPYSLAAGYGAYAAGNNAVALGYNAKALGPNSFAVCQNSAEGGSSVAIGLNNTVGGNYALAFGISNGINADYGLAFGHNVTVNHHGTTLFQDSNSAGLNLESVTSNEFAAKYTGGFRFYTSPNQTTGVSLAANTATWASLSDRRLKENIRPIENGLAKIMKLKPVEYNYLNSNVKSLGLIAQEVKEVLPEIVNTPVNKDEYSSVRYTELIPVLIEAVQELKKENERLRADIEKLKK